MPKRELTRDEFEQRYASGSGLAIGELHDMGLYAIPCNCDEPECRGWQMRNLPILLSSELCFEVEHIPDDWNGQDLANALIADGRMDLASKLMMQLEPSSCLHNAPMARQLASCPFCDSQDVEVQNQGGIWFYAVVCKRCNAKGPLVSGPNEEARRLWNKRANRPKALLVSDVPVIHVKELLEQLKSELYRAMKKS